jgi:hypothetical protein
MSAAAPRPDLAATLRQAYASLRRSVAYYLLHFVEGDHAWGEVRLAAAVVIIVLFTLFSRVFEQVPPLPLFEDFLLQSGLTDVLPPSFVAIARAMLSIFTLHTLRHLLPPLAGFVLALYFGAAYLRDLLELSDLGPAFKFLTATLFGRDYPRLTIVDGQAVMGEAATNPMLKIGGPGWVDIKLGNAALFERMAGPSAVLGAGTHFVRRFETLREAFDLREVERTRNDIQVMTKDGIPLSLNEVRVRFRIRSRDRRTESNPYPVMTNAIRQAAYSRRVTAKGNEAWADMVTASAVSTITNWIARRRMDELIPPPKEADQPEAEPATPYRHALHSLFREKNTRQKFADMGAEVIFVSVGYLRPDPNVDPDAPPDADPTGRDKIHEQLIDTWKAAQEALAKDELADAQGYARLLKETARAESLAEMIRKVTVGLDQESAQRVAEHMARVTGTGPSSEIERLLMLHYMAGDNFDRLLTSPTNPPKK